MRSAAAVRSRAVVPARATALAAAVTLVLFLGVAAAPAGAAADGLRELVPAYFAPEGSPSSWQTMCDPAAAGSIAILNPRNGPVKRQASVYVPAMAACREAGWRTVGYVFTRYGRRKLAAVEKAIAHYYAWYPGVEGIFLDEMASVRSEKVSAYYAALAAYVHERGGIVVGNPGETAETGWQLADTDLLVTFEGTAAQLAGHSSPAWVTEAGPSRIAEIAFAAEGTAALEAACADAAGDGAGSVYVTDLPEAPNPYAALPSYWPRELEAC